jgi:hypothetical protein
MTYFLGVIAIALLAGIAIAIIPWQDDDDEAA